MAKRGGATGPPAARTRQRSRSRGRSRAANIPARPKPGPEPAGRGNAIYPQRSRDDANRCALCRREVDRITVHHLVPRARGGNHGPKANLCPTCHRQVHAMFAVDTLAEDLYSVELLRAHPRVAGFLRWMTRQRGAAFPVRRAKSRE